MYTHEHKEIYIAYVLMTEGTLERERESERESEKEKEKRVCML